MLVVGVAIAVGLWVVLLRLVGSEVATETGPDIFVAERNWHTEIVKGDEGHNLFAIWVNLVATEDFDMATFDVEMAVLLEACKAVMADYQSYVPDGIAAQDFVHVDLNFKNAGQLALPYDFSVDTRDGECVNSLRVEIFSEPTKQFSKHSGNDLVRSAFLAWGLGKPRMTYSTVNGERTIKALFPIKSAFSRDVRTFNAVALCILALATISEEESILGIKIDPAKYQSLEVSIVKESGVAFANWTVNYGNIEYALSDAKCVDPQVADNG